MGRCSFLSFSRFLLAGLVVLSFFSEAFASAPFQSRRACGQALLDLIRANKNFQPREVVQERGKHPAWKFQAYSEEFAPFLSRRLTPRGLQKVTQKILDRGVVRIQVPENGFVVAADLESDRGQGNYGNRAWTRDMVRVFYGLRAQGDKENAKRVARAVLKAMSSSEQLQKLYDNILDPGLHLKPGTEMQIPQIRFDENGKLTSEPWNHRQNDALALSLFLIYRAVDDGLLTFEDLSPAEKSYLTALPVYFDRLMFWQMHDAGAWEEGNGLRSSSIGLVTKALELLQKGLEEKYSGRLEAFFKATRSMNVSDLFTPDIAALVRNTYKFEITPQGSKAVRFDEMKKKGYEILRSQMATGEVPSQGRHEDAALSHLLWEPLDDFSREEHLVLLQHVEKLARDSGVIRYADDVYLHIGAKFGKQGSSLPVPAALTQINEPVSEGHIWWLFITKNTAELRRIFGEDLEAQWTLADPILADAYGWLYEKYGFEEDLEKSTWHFSRAIGFISGADASNEGPIAADGKRMKAFRLPEAYVPFLVRNTDADRRHEVVESYRIPGENGALYWSSAELSIAIKRLWKIFRPGENPFE